MKLAGATTILACLAWQARYSCTRNDPTSLSSTDAGGLSSNCKEAHEAIRPTRRWALVIISPLIGRKRPTQSDFHATLSS